MATKEEKEKEKTACESLGKFFYDLAKMTFGVMVLGNAAAVFGFTDFTISSVIVLIFGSFMTWGFAYNFKEINYGSIGYNIRLGIDYCGRPHHLV